MFIRLLLFNPLPYLSVGPGPLIFGPKLRPTGLRCKKREGQKILESASPLPLSLGLDPALASVPGQLVHDKLPSQSWMLLRIYF